MTPKKITGESRRHNQLATGVFELNTVLNCTPT